VDGPPVSMLPALANGYVTFGNLSTLAKVSEQSLALWGRVMAAVPNSRLVMIALPGSSRARVVQGLGRVGIIAERIRFLSLQAHRDYLLNYSSIDLVLDTLPYNGHTTSLDALWMGVAVVTQVGRTVVGRAGFSQQSNLGLGELIAESEEEFVRIAVGLAGDWRRLAEIRAGLRARMLRSPLCDAAGFARGIESAYRQMWRVWCLQR
jgi:protein O-GlcNAc transferase